jgi:hypothetical protein
MRAALCRWHCAEAAQRRQCLVRSVWNRSAFMHAHLNAREIVNIRVHMCMFVYADIYYMSCMYVRVYVCVSSIQMD